MPQNVVKKSVTLKTLFAQKMAAKIESKVIGKKNDKHHKVRTYDKPENQADINRMIKEGKSGDVIMSAIYHPSVYNLLHEHKDLQNEIDKRNKHYKRLPKQVLQTAREVDERQYELKNNGPKSMAEIFKWIGDGRSAELPMYGQHDKRVAAAIIESHALITKGLEDLKKGLPDNLPKLPSSEAFKQGIKDLEKL